MQPKDTNKVTSDFIKMLNNVANDMHKHLSDLTSDEAKKLGIDMQDITKEADSKIKELRESLSKYERKINNL